MRIKKTVLKHLDEYIKNRDLDSIRELINFDNRVQNSSQNYKSVIMLSSHNLKHLQKIPDLSADAIMLNLEDGVSSELKPLALELTAFALSHYKKCDKKLIIRVNPLDEGGESEIEYINRFKPDGIRVPKIRDVRDVKRALELIDSSIELHLSIETRDAWRNLADLSIDNRVKTYYLGILDLFAELGLSQELITPKNPTLHYILSHFLITSLSCGIKPVSFVYQDYKNLGLLREFLKLERDMGFGAKGCISPDQATLINKIFVSSNEEKERALEIIELFEKNRADGITGFVSEKYGFIDEPIYKDALNKIK